MIRIVICFFLFVTCPVAGQTIGPGWPLKPDIPAGFSAGPESGIMSFRDTRAVTIYDLKYPPRFAVPAYAGNMSFRKEKPSGDVRRPWIAAFEVAGFDIALHLFDRYILDAEYAQTTWDTIKYNLRHGFVWDNDNISTNLFWHPYTGGLYFNAARSNGLGFWTSIPYAFGGSLLWECFGESEPASINDLIATPVGGIALGEITHRLSHLILDDSKRGWSRFGRELAAGIISPMGLLNRLLYGDAWRYRPVWTDEEQAPRYLRQPFFLDITASSRYIDDVDGNRGKFNLSMGASIAYGEPFTGHMRQPYDYFFFRIDMNVIGDQPLVSSANAMGLLWGREWDRNLNQWMVGVFQHFDYYDANPVVTGGKNPYKFAETASFGWGLIYKRDRNASMVPRFTGGVYANAVLLGGSESDHYKVDQRDYNLGSGYSVKFNGLLTVGKRWGFYFGMKHYQFFTWKGYGSAEEEINGLPDDANFHYANVQGNEGNARLTMINQRVDFVISRKFRISLEQLSYFRRTHYTYMDDVKATSTEGRLQLTYNFLSR